MIIIIIIMKIKYFPSPKRAYLNTLPPMSTGNIYSLRNMDILMEIGNNSDNMTKF